MSKWSGNIGFLVTKETAPGVYNGSDDDSEFIEEHHYYGEMTRLGSSFQQASKVNDDISLNMSLSIISDPFARANFAHMRYITYRGAKWKISTADPTGWPRITLQIGGLYE
jgi:hypothetical protein